ncbi:DUF805 domain-containing protein [Lactobacillaceae bacterium L1_55_11]|nr:DUF805 domain-containing protein [Lactobacillaceae bacterium L1_55_11]
MWTAYKKYWSNYARFSGKSTRADYWWVVLVNVILFVIWFIPATISAVPIIQRLGEGQSLDSVPQGSLIIFSFLVLLAAAYWLATFIPSWALQYRRFADAGLNPWWFAIVPIGFVLNILSNFKGMGWASIVSLVISVATFVITLLPSKQADDEY